MCKNERKEEENEQLEVLELMVRCIASGQILVHICLFPYPALISVSQSLDNSIQVTKGPKGLKGSR